MPGPYRRLNRLCLGSRRQRFRVAQNRSRRGEGAVENVLQPAMAAHALAQTQAVDDAAHVVRIVLNAEARSYGAGKTRRGPTVRLETGSTRAGAIDLGGQLQLFGVEAAGTAGRAPFAEPVYPSSTQCAMPAGSRGAADAEFAGNLGLGKSPLQVLCGRQAPAFHFVASQYTLCNCLHIPRAVVVVTRAIPE